MTRPVYPNQHSLMDFNENDVEIPAPLKAHLMNCASAAGIRPIDVLIMCFAADFVFRRELTSKEKSQ